MCHMSFSLFASFHRFVCVDHRSRREHHYSVEKQTKTFFCYHKFHIFAIKAQNYHFVSKISQMLQRS
eukprot:UN28160